MSNTPTPTGTGKNTGMAIIAYFLFFVPLLTDAKDDPFVKFHVKQSLLLWILAVVNSILVRIPIIGLVFWILGIGIFILWILGVINAANGSMTPVPLVGQYAEEYLKF
jgi:uncharacterized membrane protein